MLFHTITKNLDGFVGMCPEQLVREAGNKDNVRDAKRMYYQDGFHVHKVYASPTISIISYKNRGVT